MKAQFTLSPREARTVLIGLLLPLLLGPLCQNIVAPALPSMAENFTSPQDVHWVITAYLAAGTAATPIFGRLCDTWGRRRSLVLALALFLAGSACCALLPGTVPLITGRVLQGIGCGTLNALIMTILADIIPPAERGLYQGWTTATFLAGALAGPSIGGLIAQYAHWSGVFWACLGFGALSLVTALLVMRRHPRVERPGPIDLPGAALLILANTTTLLLFTDTGVPLWILLGLALAAWVLCGLRLRFAAHPLVPAHILASPLVFNATMSAALASACVVALIALIPAFMQTHLGLSTSQGGLALAPMLVGSAIGSLATGQAMMRLPRYRRIGEWGLMAAIAAMALLTIGTAVGPDLWVTELALTVAAAGVGGILPITTFSIQNMMEAHLLGSVTAANNFARQLTASLLMPGAAALLFLGTHPTAHPDITGYARLFAGLGLVLFVALFCLWRMPEHPLKTRGGA